MVALAWRERVNLRFVDAALIKPLPYKNPSGLLYVSEKTLQVPRANLSYPDYLDWKRLNKVFASIDVYTQQGFVLSTPTGSERVAGALVSDGFFSTLGIAPVLGRDFYAGEDLPAAPHTLILSFAQASVFFGGHRQPVTLDDIPTSLLSAAQNFHLHRLATQSFGDSSCVRWLSRQAELHSLRVSPASKKVSLRCRVSECHTDCQ
jgi:hypothetical protein